MQLFLSVVFVMFHGLSSAGIVRLSDGPDRCTGRVEIFVQNEWGTVCDDEWDMADAAVVCRELLCGTAIRAPVAAAFGFGKGKIWLDNVKCRGEEQLLSQCQHHKLGTHDCEHKEDASVVCSGSQTLLNLLEHYEHVSRSSLDSTSTMLLEPTPSFKSTKAADHFELGSIRLVNGGGRCAGRVEIYYNGTWGTVCDDLWNMKSARVVCRQLHCGQPISADIKAFFGRGKGNIWLDNVQCKGSENALKDCSFHYWGKHDCAHDEDAGVVCSDHLNGVKPYADYTATSKPKLLSSELGTDESHNLSTLAVTTPHSLNDHLGESAAFYDEDTTSEPLQPVSETLHQSDHLSTPPQHSLIDHLRESAAIYNEDTAKTTSESLEPVSEALHQSDHLSTPPTPPQHSLFGTEPGSIRLVNGGGHCAGRVEIYYNGIWGTVCDDMWNMKSASVVCRQLHCGEPRSAKIKAFFGSGEGSIWLDNIQCNGNENALKDCKFRGWGNHNCVHEEDAGVECSGVDRLNEVPFIYYEDTATSNPLQYIPGTSDKLHHLSTPPVQSSHHSLNGADHLSEVHSIYYEDTATSKLLQPVSETPDKVDRMSTPPVQSPQHYLNGADHLNEVPSIYYEDTAKLLQTVSETPDKADHLSTPPVQSPQHSLNGADRLNEEPSIHEDTATSKTLQPVSETPDKSHYLSTPPVQSPQHSLNGETLTGQGSSHRTHDFAKWLEEGKLDPECTNKIKILACESHQYPELIQVLKDMKSDFRAFSAAFQEQKGELKSIAQNLYQLTSSLQAMLTVVQGFVLQKDTE